MQLPEPSERLHSGVNGKRKSGTMGDIGVTSFFPSKNLGCYGDGGALFTNDDELAHKVRRVCNHGSDQRYYHEVVGVNSRLDSMQAAILRIKLRQLDAAMPRHATGQRRRTTRPSRTSPH
jgi:dTDP-4-amino-4,6-dideoxygalactose transaminase